MRTCRSTRVILGGKFWDQWKSRELKGCKILSCQFAVMREKIKIRGLSTEKMETFETFLLEIHRDLNKLFCWKLYSQWKKIIDSDSILENRKNLQSFPVGNYFVYIYLSLLGNISWTLQQNFSWKPLLCVWHIRALPLLFQSPSNPQQQAIRQELFQHAAIPTEL